MLTQEKDTIAITQLFYNWLLGICKKLRTMWFQKISTPTIMRGLKQISKGEGVSKPFKPSLVTCLATQAPRMNSD